MGLDGFLSYVKKKYPTLIKREHISLYSHTTVFFDISSYIYKYICIFGSHDGRWLTAMLQLFLTFRQNKVNIIPVFDGKAPDAKKDENDQRKEQRAKIKNKSNLLEECVNKIRNNESLTEEENTLMKDTLKSLRDKAGVGKLKTLVAFANLTCNKDDSFKEEDLDEIENYIISLRRQMVYIGEKDYSALKDMLNILGIPFKTAPNESETYCCTMIRKGLGVAVISCDSDCFSHGAKDVILSLDNTGMIEHLLLEDVLESLEITQSQMTDLAFLFGCDYNTKNKLIKVGPVKAIELIKKYERLEDIPIEREKIEKYLELRSLFNVEYPPMKKLANGTIDEEALLNFIDEHRIRIGSQRVKEVTKIVNTKAKIVFNEEE